jgi:hypothetical protein
LNDAEKKYGQKRMFWSEIFNGFSSIFLGDTLVFLLAVHFQAGNIILGLISSGIYVAGLAMPLMMKMFVGHNQEKCHAFCWQMRGLLSLGYIALFFLTGKAAVAVLVATYTLFCIFRALGVVFNDLTSKNVTSVQTRGAVLSKINTAYQGSSLVAKILSTVVTGIKAIPSLLGMIGLQVFGIITNIFSSLEYGRIPCRRTVEPNKVPLLQMMKANLTNPLVSKQLWVKAIYLCVLILVQMAVPFMSSTLMLGNNLVLGYSVLAAIGMMIASIVMRMFSDKIGAKPLIMINTIMLSFVLVIWAILPADVHFLFFFLLGFLANFFINCINLMTYKMVALVIPEENAIGFSSFVNFLIAVCALVCGVVAGYAVDLGAALDGRFQYLQMKIGNSYSLCFLLALVLCILGYVISLSVKEKGSLSASEAAQALFSMHGLRAFSVIDRIEKTKDPTRRKILLLGLGSNFAGVATSELRLKLASPFSADKVEVIRALGDCPRPALVGDLAKIALNDDSYVQLDAIGALGGYVDNPVARDALVALLDSRWGASRSMASKSLSRFSGSSQYLSRVNALSLAARHIDEEIDYLIAKRNMDKVGRFYGDFFVAVKNMHSSAYRQTRYALIASFLKFGSPRLAHLYELMNIGTTEDFLVDFLPEARDLEAIDNNYDSVFSAFGSNDKVFIVRFCTEMIRKADVEYDSCLSNLKIGLLEAEKMNINDFDIQDMLALLYFGYSLGKVSHPSGK